MNKRKSPNFPFSEKYESHKIITHTEDTKSLDVSDSSTDTETDRKEKKKKRKNNFMCHVSGVTCQVSHVMCHCQVSHFC